MKKTADKNLDIDIKPIAAQGPPGCAIITDGRYSGGSAGLAIGHISPEAAEKGKLFRWKA